MDLASDLRDAVERYADATIDIQKFGRVPRRDDVAMGNSAVQLEATALSVDIRQYSVMTNAFGRQVVVKMLKSFFEGAVRLVDLNDGAVADFNGDGMIAVFVGDTRTDNAVRTACQIKWFIQEILRARFDDVFASEQLVSEKVAYFDAGFGVDDGIILVSRVGGDSYSDFAWVGGCVNTAAKLCKAARSPDSIIITRDAYDRLSHDAGFSLQSWKAGDIVEIGAVKREVLLTSQMCGLRTRRGL